MSEIYTRIAGLSPEKRKALELLLKDTPKSDVISRRDESEFIPLSFAQQRLWFVDQLEPNNPFYNAYSALRLTGQLDVRALEETLSEIVRRHEVLRTTFSTVAGEPRQVIDAPTKITLPVEDLSHLPTEQRQQEAERYVAKETLEPFDLSRGPLMRVRLLRLAPDEHVLIVTMHHIVSDGWSMGVLLREVSVLYAAYCAGGKSPLPELGIQYADFAVWQRQWLSGAVLEEQLSYWREQLRDLSNLELPTDRVRPAVQSYRGGMLRFAVGQEETAALKELGRSEGATLFMALLAALQVLLSRYSGQSEVVVGTDIANRNRSETEGLMGFFANQLVLRTELSGATNFTEVVQRVRDVCLKAYAHQDVPFEKLVEELQPERDLSRSPLFQVKLILQNAPAETLQMRNLRASRFGSERVFAKFPLEVMIWEEASGRLKGLCIYSTDLFDRASMEHLLEHFQELLRAVTAAPELPLTQVSMLTPAEREQLRQWNQTSRDFPPVLLHEPFEQQTRQQPEATALIYKDEQMSYDELERRANQLAHYLQRLGVGPEVLVGICLERSPQMVVALLAVLKAGGAYLPLDPAYPPERLSFMLKDAAVRVLLSQRELLTRLATTVEHCVCLDEEWQQIAIESEATPACAAVPENLAYVIYTSGSTGKPKGVMITHQAICNHMQWMQQDLPLEPTDRLLQKTPFSFDASVFEFYAPLQDGAQLVLLPPGLHQDVGELLESVVRQEITTLQMVPTQLRLLVQADRFAECRSLKRVFSGGEQLLTALAEEVVAGCGAELYNLYGPTEASIEVSNYRYDSSVDSERGSVPIGRPISNTEVYVLDEELEPAPIGLHGEIHIGGVALARGYLQRAALTAEKFIPDRFSGRAGARLYRTGDEGRYLADGNIEYRGRLDQQVKLRGYRIELGEIETVLGRHEAVAQCAVSVRETESGDQRLVGYVVWELGQQIAVEELRWYLNERLPEYMVPSQWVMLAELPLTASGKVNRKALPAPEESELVGEQYVAPRTATEEIVAGIWVKVLELDQVGINDNFFELGGHSLLATQAVLRLRSVFEVELPLRSLFESPTVSSLSSRIEQQRSAGMQSVAPPIVPRNGVGEIPLSYAQQRLWFLDQLEPNNPFYIGPGALRLNGQLNVGALEKSLSEILRRHEVLRTSFSTVAGEPRQVIGPATEIELPVEDLSNLPAEQREQEAKRRAGEEARRPFDLSRGPLLRGRLLRLAADEHVLLVTMHHIVSDGWSRGVLIREASALYEAYCAGAESPLPELEIQYADFAMWQRQWLSGPVLEEQLSYWREQLRDLSTLELPTDRVRPAVQSYRGATVGFSLGREETAALKELSRREGATLFMVLLAAFQVLLSRYSGQSDVVIGTPIANRSHSGTEDLIGFFVNTLALRINMDGQASFEQLVKHAREVCLGAYEHQDVPFEKLVEELQPERDLSRSPLFQVMFVVQNAPTSDLRLSELQISHLDSDHVIARFDLTLAMWEERSGQLKGDCTYNSDLFDRASMERLLEHFQQLLLAVSATPELPLTQISMLSTAEREQLLREWNQTATYFPPLCLHELFAEQARQRPEATALIYKDEQLSYCELERRANQLAHHLQRLGVGPEVVVGICLERTPQLIVALLAVLKAGGAYLPLDPEYPLERLSFMLEDAAVAVLLTELAVVERLPAHWGYTLCLDEEWEQIASASEATPACAAAPENLAYVMYTSGSTGQPKGVMITHRNIVRLLWGIDYAHLDPEQTILQLAPISFDASTFEVWGALLHGAELQLYPGRVASAAELGEILVPGRHWTLWLTASLFNAVVDEQVQALSAVEQLLVGGEALSVGHIRRAQQELPGVQLINGYGPTEGTTFSCCYRVPGEVPLTAESIPIGRPIANTEVYILDEALEPVPVGVHGELYIGGTGVARGYLQRAGLTAEKFVPHPFSSEGGRLYRTGDECRYLADGRIEYRGRLDQQVKVRGYRIELGEIETVLGQHAAVAQCVMNVWQTESGDKRLVGYVVWETGAEATVTELRRYLSERLPEYMVPGQWVVLAELPLTANGKVDRRALPSPDDHGLDELIGEYVGPRTATEEIVAGIWAEVLEVEQVGVHDNFFEMGGHSLLATQVMSRTREAFAVELPLRSLFESPTVKGLAAQLDAALKSEERVALPPLTAVEHDGEIPLSYAQQRLWFLDQLEPNNPFYNIPAGVRLSGELNVEALERTLNEIVRRHEVLRTSFTTVAGEPRQVIGEATEIKLPLEDLSDLHLEEREQEAARLAGEEACEPFDLSRGPLLRARLLRLAADEHVLLVTMHHIVSDGWSMGVLMREVSALYKAYCDGAESPLSELAIQYADFAVWQRQWLSGAVLEEQMSYWREQLRNLNTLELPTDRVRPAVQSYRGASMGFSLSREETAALKELSRREGATLFMVLLAAFQVLLSRYSGQNDILVGTVIANRNHAETEGLIGFFVNTLALRFNLNGNSTFQQLVKHAREVCLQAYAHQDVPFEKLVEELQPERDLSRSPIVQVIFALQNAPGGALQMGNLSLRSAGGEGHTSKYDLLLNLSESDAGLRGAFEYSTDLFDASTIVRLREHLQQLLRAVTATPELPLTQISMLSAAEREQLLREWNQTSSFAPARCLHELFAEQARQRPEATALLYEHEQMSYGELERRANQLAHHLQRLGVGPEVLVGICLERTPQMVVALLAVLKAGGAYLPLDPAYPPERLSFMLEDAAVTVLLSERELLTRLAPEVEHCVCLDEEWEQIAIESEIAPECAAVPENLAYVIYTSGSTGQPKGVMITHANVWRLFQATAVQWPCGAEDVWALFHSYAFDFSVWELWGALLHGGRLVVVPYWSSRTPAAMLELLRAQQVTVLCQTPSAFQQLMQEAGWDDELAVRAVIFGGEALEAERLGEWPEQHAAVQLVNMYGITETTVHVTYSEVGSAELERRRAGGVGSVIGRGLADLEVYLLDEEMQPVPVGVPGEICIGGAGLGRGYLQRAGLTAARFIPDPFSGRAGDRLYRSGDSGRYLADGNIEYQGRLDQQVKVRGFRIELGEIEATLGQHEAVAQCVVSLRETESGDKRLVGYVVLDQDIAPTELRQYLSERLPEYMVPGQWVVLDDLPLTASGKVDRKALPAPEQSELDEEYVGPRTVTEEIVAGIWAEVLEAEQVGVHDNFFELGGHSLLATQVMSRAREAFAVELPLRNLFENPTVSSLSSRIEQQRLLATQSAAPPIVPGDGINDGEIPLSYAQQRLWFLDQLEPNNPFYNIAVGVRLSGELNMEALERTLSEIVRRHEVLRTSFISVAGEPRQVIGAATGITLPLEDLSFLPLKECEQEAERRAGAAAPEPFDLSRGPLLRPRLLRLAADEHVLLMTMHHIVSDGWSMGVLVREVSALYEAYCAGTESPLSELAIQYADFAVWQRQWLSGPVLEEQMSYWREQLRDLSMLELPTDRVRPAVQSHRGATVDFSLGREETAALKELSRREGATLFMVLLAAFQVLLSRYSGQSEVVIGTDIANRNQAETEELIGFFVNQLVLRTELSGVTSFADVLKRVREVCLQAYAHQDVPFEKLVEELQPERDLSRSPLFQVKLVLQNAPGGALQMRNLKLSRAWGEGQTSKYDLLLVFSESEAGLSGGLEYSTDLFDRASMERLLEHFQQLLRAVSATPELPLTQISMLSTAEREQLLREWNQTTTYFPPLCLHELFAEQARQRPAATALIYEDEQMSYGELERRANQLAHHLQRLGVGPEVVVGICLERTPQMIVALLAVLKAGGAYLPLDPEYPLERLSFMLEDAAVAVLLTELAVVERLPAHWGYTLCLDEEWEQIASASEATPACAAAPENLAYVMYTSGSTGQPKGVMITHRNIVRLLWGIDYAHLDREQTILQLAPISFDASTFEVWGALLHGAELQLYPGRVASAAELGEMLVPGRHWTLWLTASLFNAVVDEQVQALSAVEQLLVGGEALSVGHIRRAQQELPGVQLINGYGPTEGTTFSCCYRVPGEVEATAESIPIGRPIANTEVYILDEELEPVPVGVHGELYIGGAGVARGYLQRAGLTAEKFVPHPFSREGGRLYRTGDECRYLADGRIEYRGRLDQQVKVRGYRIELGEIETVLGQHAAVAQCVMNVWQTESGDKRLVGYVVWETGAEATVTELRRYLSERLPEYMVPGQWVVLAELPLTANGKVDRSALPSPDDHGFDELIGEYVGPRTATEEIVAGIWAEVLEVEQVGVHDNFFEMGGHSLLATQVMSRTREAFAVELPLRSLFESPTVKGLAAQLDAVLKSEERVALPPLTAVEHNGEIPLSYAQQRLWFLDQLEPNNPFYNIPAGVRLSGELNVEALERTLNEIVRRHEVLRTSFTTVAGEPRQVIGAATEIKLPVEDLSDLPLEEREQEAARLAGEEAREPFDLSRGPLLRARLLRLAADEHVLLVTMHHIVSDGWSRGVLMREVSALYEAYCDGAESPLSELMIQYADFAVWQRQWLSGAVLEEQMSYWREQLRDLSTLELPTDRVRPAVQSYRGAAMGFALGQEETAALKQLSRREGATLFMVLLAAFQVLLSRYSGQSEVVVGTDIANRNQSETEELIGFFVNQLVLRTDLSENPTFQQLLKQVREVCLQAYAHQDVPFEKLVEELQPERDLSRSPLFQVKLVLQNAPGGALQMGNLGLSSFSSENWTARFPLGLTMWEEASGQLKGAFTYSTDFDASTIERLQDHFQQLLRAIVATPELPLAQLSMFMPAEREQLRQWNQTATYFPPVLLHQLVEEQARQRPEATALLYEDEQLSYGELERRANQLAHHLQRLGVGPEVLVGVCLERTPQMVVALLAVLKAGGAYLPLDPAYPLERLSFMLEDAAVTVLLSELSVLERLPAHWGYTLCVDEEWEQIANESETTPECAAVPENLAYVIYTSGSTGQPKGVMITHQAICNHMQWMQQDLPLQPTDRVLQKTPFSFDASVWEFYAPLQAGAQLVLLPSGQHQDVGQLLESVVRQEITTLQMVPTQLRLLAQAERFAECRSLKRVFSGGEELLTALAEEVVAGSGAELYNLYGPTEASIEVSYYRYDSSADGARGSVPIGRPIPNTEMYLLDEELEPVAVGVPGEIYIGGAGLARGYLQRAALTAEKFIPDPFSGRAGARLYRTGDEGRYLADGNIEYRGRLDQQVKLRGYRIELGEVETVLGRHQAVAQCAVSVRETESGDQRLVGYVVRELGQQIAVEELRNYLIERLPEYMVPGQWVVLDELPLTTSGKVDRKALPAPEESELVGKEYGAPRTMTEEIVAGIWAEVLEVAQVGVRDNFFALGGHSLLATQAVLRLRSVFEIELPLRSLFESPTVSSLSSRIEQLRLAGTQSVAPPILPRDGMGNGEIPLSFAQQRLWFLDQLEPNNPFYNIPAGVRLSGELNIEALERTLSEVVRRHEVLRTSFTTVAGEPRQVIGALTEIKLALEDLSHLPVEEREQEAERRAAEEARESFDLSRGPLLRARLLRLAADEHVLLVTMHHIISDGWSMGVLVREVSALYQAYCAGAESPLPELMIQYADFAMWQRQWLSRDVLEEQLSYWREQLRDLSTLELPMDHVRPAVQTYRGATVRFALSQEETAALKQLSRREGATLFMVLLAAFQVLLSRYSGQSEVVIGTDVANRNHAGTEGLIGFFVNQLVLRTELSGARNFVDVVQRAREICLEAYANQDVPFEKLVEALQPERDLSRSPIVQVMFVLQNAPGGTLEMGNLSLSSAGGEGHTSKYDLMLALSESDDGLSGAFEYSTDLFDRASIVRLQEHYQQLLGAVSATPELPLTQISMLTPAEREQLLREWNQTATYFPPLCLHELFAEQARQRPEATALIYEDEQMSYDELERRANQLAHHLQRLGVGPEVLVGICLERTPQMIVALLAVLKAGGAYLPLDPAYPLERLSFMLEDARVKVLLTELSVVEQLPVHEGYTLCLDEEWERIASESEAAPECAAVPENLAYVMYTSGSTGQPKGVMTLHRNVVKLLWGVDYAHLDQEQTILQLAPISFDAATFEIWGALLHGAQLQLYPGRVPSVAELAAILKPGRHWTVHLTAALLNVVVDEQVQALRAVEQLLTGGEVVSVNHIRRLQQELPWVQLINGLGPTETTTFSLCYRLPREVWAKAESIPIGRPIANTEVYLLDDEWEPVPVGVRGELYVGGAGLARGYLRRAGLTAEKFLPDPFSGRAGARLYRSGDLGRYLADGNIEYRGRLDQQVKVRGYRIELGEIEAVLGQHATVAQCVVNVWQTESGDKRLVGYVVWELGQETTVTELRRYLGERLPGYMVPGQWVVLEQLPLTASGKVDRKVLPVPEQSELTGEYVAPRTATEEIVAASWAKVLELEHVGIHDNFFELGGHSLLATQVVLRLRTTFDVDLPLRTLFESPTVSSLSSRIEQLRLAGSAVVAPPIVALGRMSEIPLSYAQQRLWFLDQLEPNNPFYNISAGVRLNGDLNIEALERTLSEVVRRHEVLRTSFISVGGEPQQVIGAITEIKLPLEDLSHLPAEEREQEAQRLAGEEACESFDLSRGPLLRARLLRLAADEYVLLVTMHHIVSDGWSMSVLVREVSALYEAYCTGVESPLPELTIQYADFAMWQRQWLIGDVLEEQMSYWREQLRDLSTLELPTDRVRPAVQTYRGARIGFALGQEETAALKELSRREGATLFMVLLAAFQVLLSRYSGQTDIIVGTDIANRNQAETEELIGFFVNQLVLRTQLSRNPTFKQLLTQVREICLQAYAHQDVPFEKLVEELQPERDLSRSPLFQVKLVLQNAPVGALQMENLRFSDAGGEGQTAKFDLLLNLHENNGILRGNLEYSTDLFDKASIERLRDGFKSILRDITIQPEARLNALQIMTEAEIDQLAKAAAAQEQMDIERLRVIKRRVSQLSLTQGV